MNAEQIEELFKASDRLVGAVSTDFHRYLKVDWRDRLVCIAGARGTGKTTMARALKCCAEKDEEGLLSLRPYKYIGQDSADSPTVAIEGAVSRVAIFDEEYLNTYAFQQDDLLKDSFEVLVKTQKYEEHMREIEQITKRLMEWI